MNKIILILNICIFFYLQRINCQSNDSIKTRQKWCQSKGFKVAAAPMVFATASVLTSFDNGIFSNSDVKRLTRDNFSTFHTSTENYLQFAPIPVVYGLNWLGIKGKNDFWNRSILLAKSEIIMAILVYPLKNITHELRPDQSGHDSYPSGHTAEAFVAATFMSKEFGGESVWYSIGAYSVAGTTGLFRILNNKHWFSDVMMGAAIGIFTTNLVYATHQYRWRKMPGNLTLSTILDDKSKGIYLSWNF